MVEFLIIGADAAGLSAAIQIKRKLPEAGIRVINKGRFISYGACGIPYVISGDIVSPEKLIHFTPESFAHDRGIRVETNREAVSLSPGDRTAQILNLQTGEVETESYGKLLIATGANPKRLPHLDYSHEGIFNVHDIEDLQSICTYLDEKKPSRAAVIGAGNIGLELVEALHKKKMEVSLFEALEAPASNWPRAVQKAVEDKIIEKGILFLKQTAIEAVTKEGRVFTIKTGGKDYEADVLFSVIGTKPSTEFCRQKLKTLDNGAILIDQKGRTAEKDIFAAGDCATVHHRLLGRSVYWPLGSVANKMGRIAGMNMSGEDIAFPGVVGTQIFKFFELSLARTGLSAAEAEKQGMDVESFSAARTDKASYFPGVKMANVEITVDKATGRLIGANVVCEGNSAPVIDTAAAAITTGMEVTDLAWFDSAYAPPYAPVWTALISAALTAARL